MESRRVRLGRCELIVEERGRVYVFQRVLAVDGGETEEDWLRKSSWRPRRSRGSI